MEIWYKCATKEYLFSGFRSTLGSLTQQSVDIFKNFRYHMTLSGSAYYTKRTGALAKINHKSLKFYTILLRKRNCNI